MKKREKNILIGLSIFTPLVMVACFAVFSPYDKILVISWGTKVILSAAFILYSVLFICRGLYHICTDDREKAAPADRLSFASVCAVTIIAIPLFVNFVSSSLDEFVFVL